VGVDKRSPQPDAFSKALAGFEPVSPRHAAILKSWRDHSHKGEQVQLWRSLERTAKKRGLPVPQPADFIGDILGCTMPAARLNEHSEYVLDQFEKLKRKVMEAVKDADSPLDLWRDLERFEKQLRELGDYPTKQAAGGRNDVENSRDRKLFAQRMFRYLRQVILGSSYLAASTAPSLKDPCGELVKEVTVMIDIIFPTAEGTEDRTVRQWLAEISPKSMSRIVRTHI
jgi:hypothetical protein